MTVADWGTLWLNAVRPKTLTASFVPIVVATALIFTFHRQVDWLVVICALMSALLIQIGTNLINDVADFQKGADTPYRMGPVRLAQTGLVSSDKIFWAGTAAFVLAFCFGIPLVVIGGWSIVIIGLLSILCGYAYTAGPFPLAYLGLGDLFVVLFFGLISVGTVYYLQSGVWEIPALIAGLQIGLLATTLIAINNLRDVAVDSKANKKTLAVRFGERFAKIEIGLSIITPFLLNIMWVASGYWIGGLLPLLLIPFAIRLIYEIAMSRPSPSYNQFLGRAALLHLGFGILLSIGFVLQ